jgi:hypothetical protein
VFAAKSEKVFVQATVGGDGSSVFTVTAFMYASIPKFFGWGIGADTAIFSRNILCRQDCTPFART